MKDFSINIAEDGGTIQVGDKTYQVTLITPAEQELKPVEGKWYRCVAANTTIAFTVDKWYEYPVKKYGHWLFFNDKNSESGWLVKNTPNFFDLSTPLDFDPETLVGKTLEWASGVKVVVTKTEWPFLIGSYETTKAYIGDLIGVFDEIKKGYTKSLDPEPTLTVPENVEFVEWLGDPSLKYNDLILTSEDDGFVLSSDSEGFEKCKSLKLIPCNIDEVKNGEWVVRTYGMKEAENYRLVTSKGAVSFCSDSKPIEIEPLNDGNWLQTGWLKVVQG